MVMQISLSCYLAIILVKTQETKMAKTCSSLVNKEMVKDTIGRELDNKAAVSSSTLKQKQLKVEKCLVKICFDRLSLPIQFFFTRICRYVLVDTFWNMYLAIILTIVYVVCS